MCNQFVYTRVCVKKSCYSTLVCSLSLYNITIHYHSFIGILVSCVGTVCFVGTPSTDPETRLYPLPVQKVEIGTEVTLLSLKKKLIMYVYSDILPSNWIMYTIISVFKLKLQWVNLICFKKAWYHLNRRKNSYKMVLVKKIESDNRIPYWLFHKLLFYIDQLQKYLCHPQTK